MKKKKNEHNYFFDAIFGRTFVDKYIFFWGRFSLYHKFSTLLYCTVLYCTVLFCTVLYCTVLYCTVQEASLRETLSSNVTRILEGLLKEGTRCFYNYVISRRKRIAERRGGGYESKKHTLPIVPIV